MTSISGKVDALLPHIDEEVDVSWQVAGSVNDKYFSVTEYIDSFEGS